MPGIGEPNVKCYHSLVQYHCPNPYFGETIKLCIPPDMMKTARVRFYMYHKPTTICKLTSHLVCLSVCLSICIMNVCVYSTANRLSRMEPFAISHLKLMKDDDTTIQDGTHELFVYKVR